LEKIPLVLQMELAEIQLVSQKTTLHLIKIASISDFGNNTNRKIKEE